MVPPGHSHLRSVQQTEGMSMSKKVWKAGQPRLILKLRHFILRNPYLIWPDAVRETPDTV